MLKATRSSAAEAVLAIPKRSYVHEGTFLTFPRIPNDLHEKERRLSVIWEGQLSAFDLPEDVLYATLIAGWDFGAVCLAYAGL